MGKTLSTENYMRNLVEMLICPACKGSDFQVLNAKSNSHGEILKRICRCKMCDQRYPFEDGILDMLLNKELQEKYYPEVNKQQEQVDASYLEKSDIANRKHLNNNWVTSSTVGFNKVFSSLRLSGKEKVLELGAGTCWAINRFAQYGCECVAMDIIKHNKLGVGDYWFNTNNVYFERILADMNIQNFKDNTFDIVYSLATLMYSNNLLNVLYNINRVLKLGGILLLICEPTIPFRFNLKKCRKMGSGNAYTIFEWNRYVKKAGFKVVRRFIDEEMKNRLINPNNINNKNRWYYHVVKGLNPLLLRMNLDSISLPLSIVSSGVPLTIVGVKKKLVPNVVNSH